MAVDPICNMTVDPSTALRADRDGETFYFCSESCRRKFLSPSPNPVVADAPAMPPVDAKNGFVCPMHPEVEQDRPGICPICGMALEPKFAASGAEDDSELRDMNRRFWIALLLGAPVAILGMSGMAGSAMRPAIERMLEWVQFALCTPVVFWAGRPILHRAWHSVLARSPNMFTLIALGTGVAYLFSAVAMLFGASFPEALRQHGHLPLYFESAAVITILVLLGQILELRARRHTRAAIRSLLELTPPTARRIDGGETRIVPLDEVHPGDLLQVLPGDRIPVDGQVVLGASSVDESMMTGESTPIEKSPGMSILGGTLNQTGSFQMRAQHVGSDTMLAQIVRMVGDAQRSRAQVQRLADVVAAWFVPIVILIALATFATWILIGPEPRLPYALTCAVSVLVIACPCALGLATPMSIMVGMGRGASEGILVRNAEVLETLEKVDIVVVDKTGTLTEGRPRLTECAAAISFSESDVLQLAAAVERQSEHPLARAILDAAQSRKLPPLEATDFRSIPGGGIEGQVSGRRVLVGKPALLKERGIPFAPALQDQVSDLARRGRTVMLVAINDRHAGLIAVADPIKASTAEAVRLFRRLGLELLMLTGDNEGTARTVASELGIESFEAEVKPDDKYRRIKELRARGRIVAMAGDGVNDAPALAESDVGIAMGSGAGIAIESAGVTLVKSDLRGIVRALLLSRRTMRNIRQNLFFAFVYNLLGIPLAAGVLYPAFHILLNPMFAAAAMSLSSVSVIVNALRLRSVRL